MSLVKFDADMFLNEVMPDVPSCSKAIAVNAIRNAAIEFCQKSLVWVETLDPVNIVANVDVYDLDGMPNGSVIERVLNLFYLGRKLAQRNLDEVNAKRQLAAASIAANVQGIATEYIAPSVTMYAQSSPKQIILFGNPTASAIGALAMDVALVPSRTSTGIDSAITDRYLDGLVSGAKARLMQIPKKPWSDANLASYHKGEFNSAVDSATIDVARGFGRAPIRTKLYR